MKLPYFLKNLPTPARILFRPMLLISLVLHGAVLMLPLSSDLKKVKPEEQVKVTQLPATPSLPKSSVRSSPKPTPTATLNRSQPTPSTRPTLNQPSANLLLSQVKPNRSTQSETSPPTLEESDSSKSPSSTSQTTNLAPNTGNTDTNTDTDDANVKDPLEEFLSNFPFPADAEVGSLGVLPQDTDESARNVNQSVGSVIKYYGKELSDRKYKFSSPVTDDLDFKIYQVSRGGVSQYLHFITKEDYTVILLSSNKLAREDLANLEGETAEEREFKETIRETINVASTKELTDYIKSKLAGGKYNDFGILSGKNPTQLSSEFSTALEEKGFKVDQLIDLGADGVIYSLEKNNFKGFIQLIPTEDASGTAIISLDDFSF